MAWSKLHGQPGGPGKLLSERGARALQSSCPECGARPGERCVRASDYGSTWRSRPDLGRRFFELRPSQSHKGRAPGCGGCCSDKAPGFKHCGCCPWFEPVATCGNQERDA